MPTPGSRSSPASTFLLPRKPPVPVYAAVDPLTGLVTVRFDQFLRTGESNKNNWSGRTHADPFDHLFANALVKPQILGSAVTFNPELGGISGGPLTVSYSPPPWDLLGQCSLVRVQPFADFPMSGPPSYPQFVQGVFQPLIKRWDLQFSEPITVEPPAFDPRVWRTKLGPLTKLALNVTIAGGWVQLHNPGFTALDDTVVYLGGPPDWTDAEADPIQAFSHALPS